MSDDKQDPGPEDGRFISLKEDYEVEYWTKELHVDKQLLEYVILKVGDSAEAVRAWIKEHISDCEE